MVKKEENKTGDEKTDKDTSVNKEAEEVNQEDNLSEEKDSEKNPEETEEEKEAVVEETDPVKILEKKLEEANESSKLSHDRLLRATAEFENYKKRSAKEAADFRKFANESLIKELLTVIDNLERAIESSRAHDNSHKGVVDGVEMVLNEFYKVLEKFNLKSLESDGKTFDPNFHQAVMQEETDEFPENTIIKVMQKGYILHDRLIRPAMVVVAKSKAKKEETAEEK